MARPRYDGEIHRLKPTLCLREGEDDDLIAYLEQAQAGGLSLAQAVVTAMRGGVTAVVEDAAGDDNEIVEALELMFF